MRPTLRLLLTAAALTASTVAVPSASAAEAPDGAVWSETWLDTPDGERLHADVLRPEGLPADARTPVILVVSPYLGMSSLDEAPGPSDRFFDFFEGAGVFDEGYSVVQVSLRGTGGSSGCLDILGPGEQQDVVTAVRWAASQPWSTGKVGMYGKSYDANTGMVGAALRPEGLSAVVAQQVVPDRYRGSYNDKVRLLQSLVYPSATYGVSAEAGFSLQNDPEYVANSVSRSADCQPLLAEHYLDEPGSSFWTARDFVTKAEGSTVPTLMTTGYLDTATNVGGGAVDYFSALAGPKRMWIGWWAHVRGNDTADGRLAMGREGWFDEVMDFYDEHLKGVRPTGQPDPAVLAQTSTGAWTAHASWPPAATTVTNPLRAGSYEDHARSVGSLDSGAGPGGLGALGGRVTGQGAWTFSQPAASDVRLAGVPRATVGVGSLVPRTNVAVNLYDVAPDGRATMISRGAALTEGAGARSVRLFPTDWTLPRGHRLGVLVSGANAEAYVHVPTYQTVPVTGGSVSVPVAVPGAQPAQGTSNPRLERFRTLAPFAVPAATIAAATDPGFVLQPQG